MVKDRSMGNSFHERTCLCAIYRHDAGRDGRGAFSIIVRNELLGITEMLTARLGGTLHNYSASNTFVDEKSSPYSDLKRRRQLVDIAQ